MHHVETNMRFTLILWKEIGYDLLLYLTGVLEGNSGSPPLTAAPLTVQLYRIPSCLASHAHSPLCC